VVAGGYGDDTIDSGAGNDELSGNQGHDAIKSGNGHDFVLGGDGRDTLTGGAGHDTLSGGVGRDTFHWERLSERGDVITDFRPKDDTLTFSSKGFAGMTEDYGFVSSKEPVATGDVGSFLFNKTTGDLSWDQDGAGSAKAVLIVTLQNLHAIGANDLVVI
jgi:Ca2+-binding RTX toxin-like protein